MPVMKMNGTNLLHFYFLLVIIFFGCTGPNEENVPYRSETDIHLIPQPNSIDIIVNDAIIIDSGITISYISSYYNEAVYLKSLIEESSTFTIDLIEIEIVPDLDLKHTITLANYPRSGGEEEYMIMPGDEGGVIILANTGERIMNGIQTLRQLFVVEFHSREKRNAWGLPHVMISDAPKFQHRGLLLDCSRHFFSKAVIRKYIDLLAFYKMNVLHWHLTEDQGWRIAIEKYPKLTEVGAWRTELDSSRYGGFYSKADIKEIVAYATERHVTIIPEIELPGHSQAAIAAYPYLSCTGEQVNVANDWGVFKEIYCAGNDSVFIFLEDVLTEVMALFPSKYIHIGGDEAPKYRWEHCDKCQTRMRQEGLKDEHELQSYFIGRVEHFLNQKGRQLIGWDEILEGGLSPNATVQSWRGMNGGIAAANTNHKAIMSPTSHAYFDYDLKSIDLEKVYSFDPIPDSLSSEKIKYIIGGECNMWTEHVPNEAVLDSKVFPRLLAMSEVLWSYPEKKDYEAFYNRVQKHYPILSYLNVEFGEETLPVKINIEVLNDSIMIQLVPGHHNLELRYCWGQKEDVYFPFYNIYSENFALDHSGLLVIQAFKDSVEYGDWVTQSFVFHKALGNPVDYKSKFSEWYSAGGNFGLVDGKIGSLDFRDGNWQGFWGDDIDLVVDLGRAQTVTSISSNFFQYNNAWIFMPEEVIFEGSKNGIDFIELGRIENNTDPKLRGELKEIYHSNFESQTIRYIRLHAKTIGEVPTWHEAAGAKAWLFIDEIIVK